MPSPATTACCSACEEPVSGPTAGGRTSCCGALVLRRLDATRESALPGLTPSQVRALVESLRAEDCALYSAPSELRIDAAVLQVAHLLELGASVEEWAP